MMEITLYKEQTAINQTESRENKKKQLCKRDLVYLVEFPAKTFEGFLYLLEWNSSNTIDERFDFGRLLQVN